MRTGRLDGRDRLDGFLDCLDSFLDSRGRFDDRGRPNARVRLDGRGHRHGTNFRAARIS